MNDRQMMRYRREMHRRIREVVAERRLARHGAAPGDAGADASAAGHDQIGIEDETLVGG